jgi:hypothetical protein
MTGLPTSAGVPAMNTLCRIVCLLVCLFAASGAHAADSYLCVAELTTGFTYDAEQEVLEERGFPLRKEICHHPRQSRSHMPGKPRRSATARPAATCERDFNEAGNLFCSGVFDLRFNKRQQRFLYVYPIGYWSDAATGVLAKAKTRRPGHRRCKAL